MKPYIPVSRMGEAWSSVKPFQSEEDYGTAKLEPSGSFVVRSKETFRLTYRAGKYGVDDTGAIRVAFRMVGDADQLQTTDPSAPNYVSAVTNANATLNLVLHRVERPRTKGLTVTVNGGFVQEGEEITIIFGDTSQGSPGFTLQTFTEKAFEFRVSVDVCATGHFVPLNDAFEISMEAGEEHSWKAVLPTLRNKNQSFYLGVKAEDIWGNPTFKTRTDLQFTSSLPVEGLPKSFSYSKEERAVKIKNLKALEEGVLRIQVLDENGTQLAESNPMVVKAADQVSYWGDLHGQSGESVATGSALDYFVFARDCAFLDVTSHQANDFQVNNEFWKYLNEVTAKFQEDGEFVAIPGYEWSGNTGVGGDRNVFFKNEGCTIRRSSHALLPDRSDIDTDACNGQKLFKDLEGEDCAVYAHVGGRYANVHVAHDPKIETAMEIHSAWGTFEWIMADCFELGYRVGVVANSDDHKGRPGGSYPGASTFGAFGGFTCFIADDLTRDGIFDSLRKRHHYATTGSRIHMEVYCDFDDETLAFNKDPKAYEDVEATSINTVMMGDIAETKGNEATLRFNLSAHTGIQKVEVRNGVDIIDTLKPYSTEDLGSRIRVIWSGAEYRGRGRETFWAGNAAFIGAEVNKIAPINFWNPERKITLENNVVEFDSITTGNLSGFDAWIKEDDTATLKVETDHGSLNVKLAEVSLDEVVEDCGGLERKLKAIRLPAEELPREFDAECIIPLKTEGDNPLWICVTMEDGSQAWSSPVYVTVK